MVTHLLLGLLACAPAHPACTCTPGPRLNSRADVAGHVNTYAAVFEGTVVRTASVEDSVVAAGDTSRPRRAFRWTELEVTLAISRRWKGELGDTVTLRTPASTTMCGADFTDGRTYLVFARTADYSGVGPARPAGVGEVVHTTKCSPSTWGREARRMAVLLGRPLPAPRAQGRPLPR